MIHFFVGFQKAFRHPDYDINVNISRVVLGLFMMYKLMSRDFGFYGSVPAEFFTYYPISIYKAENYKLWLGLPILTEIFTMHWVHWILPRPSIYGLRIIQGIVMASLLLFTILGSGPRRVYCLTSILGLVYLWGHMTLGGHEVDSIMLYFGMILVFLFAPHTDLPVWRFYTLWSKSPNKNAGISRSLILFVFAAYYYASGYNKLTDVLLIETFDSELNNAIKIFYIRDLKGYVQVPDILYTLAKMNFYWFDIFGPIAVYLSHLCAPLVLFDRTWVWKFAIFYICFHFIVFGVGISFLGYVIVWLVVLPWRSMLTLGKKAQAT